MRSAPVPASAWSPLRWRGERSARSCDRPAGSCWLSVGLLRSVGRYGKVRGVAAGHDQSPDRSGERAERRAARQAIGDYHEAQLRLLLGRVRDGFARLDTGGIDVFELDELIHRYKRSARELWKFCGQTGSDWVRAVRMLEFWRAQGEDLPDWWHAASHAADAEAFYAAGGEPVRVSLRTASGGQRSSRSPKRPTGRASRSVTQWSSRSVTCASSCAR